VEAASSTAHQEQDANWRSVLSQKTVIHGRLYPLYFVLPFRNSCRCILCFSIYNVFNDAVSSADYIKKNYKKVCELYIQLEVEGSGHA